MRKATKIVINRVKIKLFFQSLWAQEGGWKAVSSFGRRRRLFLAFPGSVGKQASFSAGHGKSSPAKTGQIAAIAAAGPEDWVHADIFPRAPIMKKERPAMAEEHIEVLEKY